MILVLWPQQHSRKREHNEFQKIMSARRGEKCSAMQEQRKDGAGDLGRLRGRGGQELGSVNRNMG